MATGKPTWRCVSRSLQHRYGMPATGRRTIARYQAGDWDVELVESTTRGLARRRRYSILATHRRLGRIERLDGFRDSPRAVDAMQRRIAFLEGIGRTWLEGPRRRRR